MYSLSGIRTEILEHTGRSSRHEISAPGRNTALSRVLKVPNRNLQTPQELHPPLADIRQIERCAAMMRTSFQHGKKKKRDSGEYVSVCRGQYSPRAPVESSDHYFRRRHSGFQARHDIKPIKQRACIPENQEQKLSTQQEIEVGISMPQLLNSRPWLASAYRTGGEPGPAARAAHIGTIKPRTVRMRFLQHEEARFRG